MAEQANVGADALALPKGGGALQGLGESFAANLFTGTGNLTVPLQISSGRHGFSPTLNLQYSTGGANGAFGLGWALGAPSIRRKTDNGVPRYGESDVFVLSGADDLVERVDRPARTEGDFRVVSYRPCTEGLFARIERWQRTQGAGPAGWSDVFWRVSTKDGATHIYGRRLQAVLYNPAAPHEQLEWQLELSCDPRGNIVLYEYKREDRAGIPDTIDERNRAGTHLYLKRVRYGNRQPVDSRNFEQALQPLADSAFLFSVLFDYGEHGIADNGVQIVNSGIDAEQRPWSVRPDPFSSCRGGFDVRTYRRCQRVILLHHRVPGEAGLVPVRSYDFEYRVAAASGISLLSEITTTGFRRSATTVPKRTPKAVAGLAGVQSTDFDVASLPPLVLDYTEFVPEAQTYQAIEARGYDLPPFGLGQSGYALVDLFGSGLPDVVELSRDQARYWRNLGSGLLDRPRSLPTVPSVTLDNEGVSFGDMNGNGRADLLVHDGPLWGFYELAGDAAWQRFKPYLSRPSFLLSDPHIRFTDMTGDGRSDVLRADAEELALFPGLGEEGFGEPIRIARIHDLDRFPDLDFTSDRVFLADLNGDGLKDLVLVHAGRIDYWPNLGWGRFGARITMANSPMLPLDFDPRRLLFTDLDGGGPDDLVYVESGFTRYWINRSGNGWSEERRINGTPLVTDDTVVRATDFLGTGCTGLLWSGSRTLGATNYGFLDFTGGTKPHLLRSSSNSIGSETRVEMKPSTHFVAAELREGRRWAGYLPFPVQVVARVVTVDRLTGAQLSHEYSYAHGAYDGAQRKFIGFARVDALDGERLPGAQSAQQVPPLLTRDWYHVGLPDDEDFSLAAMLADKFAGDPQAFGASWRVDTADSIAGAYRSLRGAKVRSEMYVLDGSSLEPNPMHVVDSGFQVRNLQLKGTAHAGVFQCSVLESFTYNYERQPLDPRVGQQIVVELDPLGYALKTVSVVYPRRVPQFPEQAAAFVTCDRNAFVHVDTTNGLYRNGMLVSEEKVEVALPAALPARVTLNDVLGWNLGGSAHRRFTCHRNYYDGPAFVGLALGQVGARGLLTRSEALVFDVGHRAALYGAAVTSADLTAAGFIESTAGSDQWWQQDTRVEYGGTFLQSVRALDALGQATLTEFDGDELLPVATVDAVNNRHSIEHDPWTLQRMSAIDCNGNRSRVVFDPLGMVIATISSGKDGANEGDTLARPTAAMSYDLHACWRANLNGVPLQPCSTRTLQRTVHASVDPNAMQLETVTYFDGLGRELQTKTLVESDAAAPGVLRWVGSGWQIRNNKGWVIQDHEPYFSASDAFDPARQQGEATVTTYDALGRVIRKLAPDGAFNRIEYTAWSQVTYDANDTCQEGTWYTRTMQGDSYAQDAATKAQRHIGTPTTLHFDPLNRSFLSVEDGGAAVGTISTRTRFDIQNNPLEILDADGVVTCRSQFSLLKHVIVRQHVDSGKRVLLPNAVGDPVRRWDDLGRLYESSYDAVRRLILSWVTDAGARRLVESTTYGESHPQALDRNLRGRPFERRDSAGLTRFARYDFKGNTLDSELYVIADPSLQPDWTNAAPAFTPDSPLRIQNTYDACNRVVTALMPDSSRYRYVYNQSGLPERLEVTPAGGATVAALTSTESDARGRRIGTTFGNGVTTTERYDPLTQRISSVDANRGAARLQALRYSYDAIGNLTSVRDDVAEVQFFGNAAVNADRFYTYDALNRMTEARGREHAIAAAAVEHAAFDPVYANNGLNDLQAVRRYTETYRYDTRGNLTSIQHAAANGNWTRQMNYAAGSNRVVEINPGKTLAQFSFQYDNHGNVQAVPAAQLTWDHRDRIVGATLGGGGQSWYQHDATGRRVRKVIRYQNGTVREILYTGHLEYEREYASWAAFQAGTIRRQQTRLHVMEEGRRICLIDTVTRDAGAPVANPAPLYRYQLHGESGSSTVEVDANGAVLSVEEYSPLGTSFYTAYLDSSRFTDKRYRFGGQEFDGETGLYLMGARHYAPWLGRWMSCDPAGESGGINPYAYVANRFVNRSDVAGRYDPAAFGDQLVGYIDVAEKFYLAEDRHVGTSLWNTAVATIATVARGSTSIFKVGTGAAQGVEQIKNAQDGWDYAIGACRLLSDAGEIASAATGIAGTTAKTVQTVKLMQMERQLKVLQTQRAIAKGQAARELSDQIGVLQTEKLATKAGLVDEGQMNILSKQGSPTRNGVDKAYSGSKPFTKNNPKIVEAKARAEMPADVTETLGTARGNVQGSAAYNVERVNTAAQTGNTNAANVANKMGPGGTHESYLVTTEVGPTSQPQVFRLENPTVPGVPAATSAGATPVATAVPGLPDANPFTTIGVTAGATTASQGYKQQQQ